MEDLHQVPDALLPDVEGVLPGRPGHDVLTVARETAALPRSPAQRNDSNQSFQESADHRGGAVRDACVPVDQIL